MKKVQYNGYWFTLDKKTGYYLSSRPIGKYRKRLHRYIYENEIGEIPKGSIVHHIDHNKDNNNINNLKLLTIKKHNKYHSNIDSIIYYKEKKDRFIRSAHLKAKEWHKSIDGKEWHKKHYEYSLKKVHIKECAKSCIQCGSDYLTSKKMLHKSKFCSNKCKAKHRRDNGIDNIIKNCVICGREFLTNKYSNAKSCSPKCRGELKNEGNKNKIN